MSDANSIGDTMPAPKHNLHSGKVVFAFGKRPGYRLEHRLGKGGMGEVWLAEDLEIKGRVALKFLPETVRGPDSELAMKNEILRSRDLAHEHIVVPRSLEVDDENIAVQMQFIDGPTVSKQIESAPDSWLEIEQAAPIVRGLCLAIDFAHRHNIVHRDIKPLNLLLTQGGVVKVADFGLAYSISTTIARRTQTAARTPVSAPYASPQQIKGEVDPRNDVYSIGATLYEMLTGTPPFRSTDLAVLLTQIPTEVPPAMAERRRRLLIEQKRQPVSAKEIPKVWEQVVADCLQKDPAKRPPSARDIAVRLGLIDPPPPPPKTLRVVLAVLGATLAIAGYFAWASRSGSSQVPAAQPAPAPEAPAKSAKSEAKAEAVSTPVSAPAPLPRQTWQLSAPESVTIAISDPATGAVLFEGTVAPAEKHPLPLDRQLLVELKKGPVFSLEADGQPLSFSAVPSNRWLMTLSANPAIALAAIEAPPPPKPFEAEVGPLVKAGSINAVEDEWLRASLGGANGNAELLLAQQLVAKSPTLTIGQWRARTTLKFTPDAAALRSTDPQIIAHAIDLALPGGAEVRLLRIEPGRFYHGSPTEELGRRPSDATYAQVSVAKPYFIAVTEITQRQYESIMKASPSWWRGNPAWPIDGVTWNLLMGPTGFIPRLNLALGKSYDGLLVADLPSDDEWEYACRAGTTTSFNNGTSIAHRETDAALDGIAHYNKVSSGSPRPVGTFAPNAWGLYDMHGNVQEWTSDHTVRGGSWQSNAANCRAAARAQMSKEAGSSNQTGFRLILRFKEKPAGQ